MNSQFASLAFTCLRCGNCCQGEGGIVLTAMDITRLCSHLQLTVAEFSATCMETVGGKQRLRTKHDGWCLFFNEGCSVHPAKPSVCRAWPFFRGNMVDASSWEMAQDACPGINAQVGHAQFVLQGREYLRNLELEEATDSGPNALTTSSSQPDKKS
jgi:uncharacterized protein